MISVPGGTALVEELITEALDFRQAMRKVEQEWGSWTGGLKFGALPIF